MNSKTLLILLVLMFGAIGIMSWKVRSTSVASGSSGSEAVTLSTDPNPLRPGPATFMIDVKDKSGNPVDGATVSFDLNMTTMNMGTQQGNAASQGNGRYSATGTMSMRGPWRVSTKVTLPDGSVVNKSFITNVP